MEEKSKEEEEASSKKTVAAYIKRCLFLIVGLCIMAVGVVLSIKAALGTSPISSIPYVLNLITGLTVGTTTIIVNTLIVLLQIALLRKRFKLIQLLQIPVCIVFGFRVREGTVAAAVFVGMLAKQLNRFMIPFGQKLFRSSEKRKKRQDRYRKIIEICQ